MTAPKDPTSDPTALGTLARAYSGISGENIRRAVEYQREHPEVGRLGDALIKLSLMDQHRVNELVAHQAVLRRGRPTSSDVSIMTEFALRLSRRVASHVETLAAERRGKPKK